MTNRSAIDELTVLFDHILEEHGFGWDHWHSLLWNLHNVRPEDWDTLPAGGGRTIRELVIHIGRGWIAYGDNALRGIERRWGDDDLNGILPGTEPEEIEIWLRAAHARFRSGLDTLTDDRLNDRAAAPWGEKFEIRRLIELQIQTSFYHIGEINHIRALLQGNDDWDHQDMGREDE
ncbi:MAG: DinB family protein [Thermomicrobiales bacterium]|nr:DinB family protein [Thermomicrobiales bacterium]